MKDPYTYILVKGMLTLIFLLGIAGAALYALKYFSGGLRIKRGGRPANPIRVVSTAFLGQKKNIAVVDVAGELLVVGVTPSSITCLARVESKESVEEIKRYEGAKIRPFFELF